MIPKIIHYCWLSNDPIPDSLMKCMNSWKKILPDYKLIHWDFKRFDKSSSLWVSQAFDNKKYAFAADYIRLYALYHYGGIYLDMDVEVLKSFDPFLSLQTMLCWQKDIGGLEVAAFGAPKEAQWVKDCLEYYKKRPFVKQTGQFDTKPLPYVVEDILKEKNYILRTINTLEEAKKITSDRIIPVFTSNYFSPKSYKDKSLHITDDTYSIHHFAGTWLQKTPIERFEEQFWKFLKIKNLNLVNKVKWTWNRISNKMYRKKFNR